MKPSRDETSNGSWMGNLVHKLPYGVRRIVERYRHTALVLTSLSGVYPRTCPICGYHGNFRAFNLPPQFDAMCGKCDSLERHRLFVLMNQRHGILNGINSLLHFAPEPILQATFRKQVRRYLTADLFQRGVDYQCNIEDTGITDTFDAIFVSHVLEHVNDRKALAEFHRILATGGKLIAMVPIVDGWQETYENCAVSTEEDRFLHFGQKDHVRFYGSDFVNRIEEAGFEVTTYMGTPLECVEFGLMRGEKIFVGTRL